MRADKQSTALVVRPRSFWRYNVLISLAAFGLTILAVYFISQIFLQKSSLQTGSKAIAVVEQKAVKDRDNFLKSSALGSSLNLKNIKIRMMSPEFMRQALSDCAIEISSAADKPAHNASFISLEELREGLRIYAGPGASPDGNRIALELTLLQSPDVDRIVRALADRFVREYRTFWAAEAKEAYIEASARADQAQQANLKAIENLREFKEIVLILKQGQLTPEQQQSQTQTAPQTTSQTVDNPAWIEINGKLQSLRRQEADMLVNKTELHPDIQYIRGLIADFERQLAVTPQFSAESSSQNAAQEPALPPGDKTDKTLPPENEKENRKRNSGEDIAAGVNQIEMAETLQELQDAVKLTQQKYLNDYQRKQQVYEAGRKEPIFSVRVSPAMIAKKVQKSNQGVVGLMLFSAFAIALGTSVLLSGIAAQPVLATIADLEMLMPAPIIGVVPGKDRSVNPVARRRHQVIVRWTLILTGGLIVLGCIGGVCWLFIHLG